MVFEQPFVDAAQVLQGEVAVINAEQARAEWSGSAARPRLSITRARCQSESLFSVRNGCTSGSKNPPLYAGTAYLPWPGQ